MPGRLSGSVPSQRSRQSALPFPQNVYCGVSMRVPSSKHVVFLFIILLALCFPAISLAASVQKIGPDLYAYISDNDSSANSTFLVGSQGILVVDTGLNAQEGRKLLGEIRKISSAPVRWIVNTHYHPDHHGGNSAVGPDAFVISTEFTRTKAERDYTLNETLGPNGL